MDRNLDIAQQRQFQSMNYLVQLYKNNTTPTNIEAYFNYFGLKVIENQNLGNLVIERGNRVFSRETPIGRFSSITYNGQYYLFVSVGKNKILLKSDDGKNSTDHLWIGFTIALIVLISTYISIIRSFRPLQTLTRNIRRFASGDMSVSYKSDKNDEIAEVANEFDKAVKKIRNLILSRQLFLRTIMHELKTPIGKGRIVSEMVQDEIQKERLVNVFERLDLLLNEFSKIEQLVSQSYTLKLKSYPISTLVEQASDMLMLEKSSNILHIDIKEDKKIAFDFDLMSLAIKNLLDNAIKYSQDGTVHVQDISCGLRISNKGEKLKFPISHYMSAFVSEEKSHGMGLGLYIVQNIIEQHGYKLVYTYENGYHCFDVLYEC